MKKLLGVLAVAGLALTTRPVQAGFVQAPYDEVDARVLGATITVDGAHSWVCLSADDGEQIPRCIRADNPRFKVVVDATSPDTRVRATNLIHVTTHGRGEYFAAESVTVIVRSETVRREWLRRIRLALPPKDVLPKIVKK